MRLLDVGALVVRRFFLAIVVLDIGSHCGPITSDQVAPLQS